MRFILWMAALAFAGNLMAAEVTGNEALVAKGKSNVNKKAGPATNETSESSTTNTKSQNVANAERQPSSYEGETTSLSLHPARPTSRDWYLRFTGAGGFSSTGSNTSRESQARSDGGYAKTPNGLLSVEGQYGRYVGAELEGNYGLALSKTYSAVDPVTGNPDARSRSLSQSGIMFDLQGRFPLSRFRRDWGFHGGLGYGSQSVHAEAPVYAPTSVNSTDLSSNGLYATLGVEVRAIPEISILADYAMSLGASTKLGQTGATGTATSTFASGSFDRIRLQAAYILQTNYRVGMMYVRRKVSGDGSSAAISALSETSNQFLATFQWIL